MFAYHIRERQRKRETGREGGRERSLNNLGVAKAYGLDENYIGKKSTMFLAF